jgi:hypothetical protein
MCTATQLDHRCHTRHKGHQQASSEEVQTIVQQVNEERKLVRTVVVGEPCVEH